MANFEDQLSMHDEPSAQEMEEMMSQKAHELFELCDKEQKGFITKRDMQRLQSELPLSPDQLEAVFDSLDDDRNGFLTLEEFTGGFGSFLGLNPSEGVHEEEEGDANVYEELDDAVEEDRQFHQMMSNLGAANLFDDENTIKSVWSRIRRNEPEVVSNFEDFLYKISNEIRKSKLDFNTLESALKSKSSAHDQEVQKLYEEMEYQIKAEKERVLTEEQTKERQLREAMEQEIKDKDRQLQDLLMKHQEMEERLSELNLVEVETKQENDKLMKEKESLEELLLKSEENLEESKAYINQLRSQQRDEKRERAKAALKLTEGIALERESLVKQLDTLKDVNKKLRDDKDEAETRRDWANDAGVSIEEETKQILAEETTAAKQPSSRKKELCKQGSILGNYFGTNKRGWGVTESLSEDIESDVEHDGDGTLGHHGVEGDDEVEIDDYEIDDSLNNTNQSQINNNKHLINGNNAQLLAGQGGEYKNGGPTSNKVRKTNKSQESLEDITSSENEAGTKQGNQQKDKSKTHLKKKKKHLSDKDENGISADSLLYSTSQRGQPVGADEDGTTDPRPPKRERLFKVVFVGDSGVGKSSFIHRFCNDQFNPSFSATIDVLIKILGFGLIKYSKLFSDTDSNFADHSSSLLKTSVSYDTQKMNQLFPWKLIVHSCVDFQVKSIEMEDQIIVLQLWDTAGQERFRSITKQYFRKADGVVVLYDVTSEASFTSVKNWMVSVQDGVEEGTIILMVGNKTDLSENDDKRVVKLKDGSKLAMSYDALFYETSAKNGTNIKEAVEALASLLKDKQDEDLEKALHLQNEPVKKKKGCCG